MSIYYSTVNMHRPASLYNWLLNPVELYLAYTLSSNLLATASSMCSRLNVKVYSIPNTLLVNIIYSSLVSFSPGILTAITSIWLIWMVLIGRVNFWLFAKLLWNDGCGYCNIGCTVINFVAIRKEFDGCCNIYCNSIYRSKRSIYLTVHLVCFVPCNGLVPMMLSCCSLAEHVASIDMTLNISHRHHKSWHMYVSDTHCITH